MTERRADEASRDVEAWLKCYYMRDRVGDEFEGSISGVASFGVFVALDEVYVEGLLHVSELGNDYFHFDPVGHLLRGDRTRRTFRLADRIRVRVVRVDLEQARIDFVLP
jgi:ribonuclease R